MSSRKAQKKPAQLDREINAALLQRRRHHAARKERTVEDDIEAASAWVVATDAMQERDGQRAAFVVKQIAEGHPTWLSGGTTAFNKALREAPSAVRATYFETLKGHRGGTLMRHHDGGGEYFTVHFDPYEFETKSGKLIPYSFIAGVIREEDGKVIAKLWYPAASYPHGYKTAALEALREAAIRHFGRVDKIS